MRGDTVAGRYRVEKLLGAGSSGFVVAARHVYLRRRVTLKLLTSTTRAQEQAQRRHLAAAHIVATLRSPHIARIVDTGFAEDGTPFIATEYLEGRTLAAELAARKQLPPAEAVRWLLQACEGLAEAHAAGVVHGDLKPQNLFFADAARASSTERGGESRILKVLDFGMSTPADTTGAEEGTAWFASPAYLAPEQIRDPDAVDARTDVWALGVILYELIAGQLPFSADTISGMLVAVAYDEPALLAAEGVPFELARLVALCLAKDPAQRPPNVAELARRLAPFGGADGVTLATRVEAALSSAPPAVTVESEPAADAGAVAEADDARPAATIAGDVTSATRFLAAMFYDDVAVRRRRAGAIAAVGAAALLAIVGLLTSPRGREPDAAVKTHAVDPSPLPSRGSPPPFLPRAVIVDERASKPLPPPSAPPPSADKPREPKLKPHAGAATTERAPPMTVKLPKVKRRPTLSVRENPYGREGFTHPSRLSRPK